MNPEICASTRIMKVINKHVDELDGCRHSIVEIMKEAFQTENNGGIRPPTGEHQVSTSNNTSQGIDIDNGK